MSFDRERLLELLPAVYRLRDSALKRSADEPGPLEGYVGILAEQAQVIEESLAQLYDDQFIETCAEWVVPYIAELVGARGFRSVEGASFSLRAFVANTIAYRRRKGTASILEQVARDVTGWDAAAVEFFERLVATQNMNHIRGHCLATTDLRKPVRLQWLDTAFGSQMHLPEVRRIGSRRGRYNIPNVGVFLWRIRAYPLTKSDAFRVDDRRWKFDPRGRDTQLYQNPIGEADISTLATPANVPLPISRRSFAADEGAFYGTGKSMRVHNVDVSNVVACDLSDVGTTWMNLPTTAAAVHIDPVLGRIAFGADQTAVLVDYHYGFTADIGGGEYERGPSFELQVAPTMVGSGPNALRNAINSMGSAREIVLEIADSRVHDETSLGTINLQPGQRVEIRAATGFRPTLRFPDGEVVANGGDDSALFINGFQLVNGGFALPPNTRLARFEIRHCTILPNEGVAVIASPGARATEIVVSDSIVGGVYAPEDVGSLTIRDSIVHAPPSFLAIGGNFTTPDFAGAATLERCTIVGDVRVKELTLASEVLFTGAVSTLRTQTGCVRFCYLGPNTRVPRRYRCQPDLAIEKELARLAALVPRPAINESAVTASVRSRVEPSFTSLTPGHPGYAQLAHACAVEIRTGAEDGSEIGVFRRLQHGRREANLRAALEEYLRFGLEAGIFYVS